MLDRLRKLLTEPSAEETFSVSDKPNKDSHSSEIKLQLATCALFIETARSDYNFTVEEYKEIISIMQKKFGLEKKYIEELIELAKRELEKSVSICEFTKIINEKFSHNEKFELMKNIWRLIYADKKLDKYEDQLVKKIGAILSLGHKKDVIAAKLLVKNENS